MVDRESSGTCPMIQRFADLHPNLHPSRRATIHFGG
jgi:hypothetical protein